MHEEEKSIAKAVDFFFVWLKINTLLQYVKCNLAKIQKCMRKITFFVFCYKKSVKFLTISDKRKIIITVYIGKHWINHFTHLVCIFSVSSPKKSSQYVSIPAVFWTNWRKIWRHNLCKWFNQCFPKNKEVLLWRKKI